MTIEQTVLTHLLAGVDVAAVVGTRGYQLVLPQKPTLPALRVQRVSDVTSVNLIGEVTNQFWARVQVDVWATPSDGGDGYATAQTGATAVKNRLALISAGGQSFTDGEIVVSSVQPLDTAAEYVAGEFRQIRVRQDFGVRFSEVQ